MVAVLVREGVVKTVLQKFSIRNCQLPTIKIESKNYGKSDFGCCIPQTYYSLSELSLKPKQIHLMCRDLNIDHSKANAKF